VGEGFFCLISANRRQNLRLARNREPPAVVVYDKMSLAGRPMAEHPESPELVRPPADPELLALPGPPRQERTISLALMAVTGLLAAFMTAALAGDVRYALASPEPHNLGDLARVVPDAQMSNTFVRGTGRLRDAVAIQYDRPLERDSFRLAPLVDNDRIWVEMRVPAGIKEAPISPPTTFVGRLLPLRSIAFGLGGLRRSVEAATGNGVPQQAWVLADGATPASSRWTLALAALLAMFAGYNFVTIGRILRPVRR
jgi:hypothetical protein